MAGNLVVNVTIAKWFVERRGRASGIAAMGVSFAGISITPFAAFLIDEVGWREAWQWLALGAVLVLIPVSFLMRRTPEDHGLYPDGKSAEEVAGGGGARAAADYATSMTRAQALRTRSFYLIVSAFGFGVLSVGVILINAIPYMEDAGYPRTTGALMITVVSIPEAYSVVQKARSSHAPKRIGLKDNGGRSITPVLTLAHSMRLLSGNSQAHPS